MGARNTKPQTVEMKNPAPFQITREVVERLELMASPHWTNNNNNFDKVTYCENCKRTRCNTPNMKPLVTSATATNAANTLSSTPASSSSSPMKATEVEEIQFDKTFDRVNKLFGNPVNWSKPCTGDIDILKQRVINCYREYRQEPLMCANIAKQYHNYIFNKHFETLINMRTGKNTKNPSFGNDCGSGSGVSDSQSTATPDIKFINKNEI